MGKQTLSLAVFLAVFGFVMCKDAAISKPLKPRPFPPKPVSGECCCPHDGKVMALNLFSGSLENDYTLPYVSVLSIKPNPKYAQRKCSRTADLKVTFQELPKCWDDFNQCMDKPICGNRMLKIELTIHPIRGGFLYNVGDSATNNGYGGDSNTQVNDAEIMGLGSSTYVYSSDKCPKQKETLSNILTGAKYVTLYVGNHFTRVQTKSSSGAVLADKEFCNKCLFALNMQGDGCTSSGNPLNCRNMDIYVSLNKVIKTSGRYGYGVCKAKLSWECCEV